MAQSAFMSHPHLPISVHTQITTPLYTVYANPNKHDQNGRNTTVNTDLTDVESNQAILVTDEIPGKISDCAGQFGRLNLGPG